MPDDSQRSSKPIRTTDLRRLGEIARTDADEFFRANPAYGGLAHRVLAIALCQGAGLHYLDGKNGIKDFDVWTFYAVGDSALRFPPRRRGVRDFGDSRFGKTPGDEQLIGRRVDCFWRSLLVSTDTEPVQALRNYLSRSRTKSARCLALKGVVLVEPPTFSEVSRGRPTQTIDRSGAWPMSVLERGRRYTREEIREIVGGGQPMDYLPSKDGEILAGCFRLDLNPSAPRVVLVGHGPRRVGSAEALLKQGNAVPIFLKRLANQWEYCGDWRAVKLVGDHGTIAANSGRPNEVARVLFLEEV